MSQNKISQKKNIKITKLENKNFLKIVHFGFGAGHFSAKRKYALNFLFVVIVQSSSVNRSCLLQQHKIHKITLKRSLHIAILL